MQHERGSASRKAEHLRINLTEDVSAKGVDAGFDRYRFLHQALPEIDLEDVRTDTGLFGRPLRAPILISCMTGGVERAREINRVLAMVAQDVGLALGLGSGRVLLQDRDVLNTFAVRDLAPSIPILANLGAVQLTRGTSVDDCRNLVDLLQADALVLHLNPLQEALQPGGDTTFRGVLDKIETLCRNLPVPVVVKEVGWGLAPDTVQDLVSAGVAAVDVAGAGGTSWSEVERHRIDDPVRAAVAAAFAGWGIPTTQALTLARSAAPNTLLIASGGVRDGVDVAKALALGADLVGMAGPFLRAAAAGLEDARGFAVQIVETLRVVMFCVGAETLLDLRSTSRLLPVRSDM